MSKAAYESLPELVRTLMQYSMCSHVLRAREEREREKARERDLC